MGSLGRWLIKKTARGGVVLASAASGSTVARRMIGAPKVRVLTYHQFGDTERDPWCVSPRAFEQQMQWLAEQRLAVGLNDILKFARGEIEIAEGSVLVTMDDGYSSWLSVAAPILRHYAIPAVAYISTKVLEDERVSGRASEGFLTWDQVIALSATVTIGSHGHTHRSMARIDPAEASEEGRLSKALIEARLGRTVTSFAYPFGMRRDESPATAKLLADCGYRSVFISQHGTIRRGTDVLRLPRIKVEGGEPLWMFKLLCQGAMDAWSLADRLLQR